MEQIFCVNSISMQCKPNTEKKPTLLYIKKKLLNCNYSTVGYFNCKTPLFQAVYVTGKEYVIDGGWSIQMTMAKPKYPCI